MGVPSVAPVKPPGGSHTAGLVAWNTTVAAAAGGFGSYLYLYGFREGNVEEGRGGDVPWGTASSFPKKLCRKRTPPRRHAYHWHHQFQRHIILSQTHLNTMWIEDISSTLQAWHCLGNTKHQQRSTPPEIDPSRSDLSLKGGHSTASMFVVQTQCNILCQRCEIDMFFCSKHLQKTVTIVVVCAWSNQIALRIHGKTCLS